MFHYIYRKVLAAFLSEAFHPSSVNTWTHSVRKWFVDV